MMLPDQFLSKIDAFLRDSGMSASAFGHKAVNDPMFVFDLRDGRSPSLRVAQKALDFIDASRREMKKASKSNDRGAA